MEAFLSGLVLTTLLSSLKGFFLSELLSEGRIIDTFGLFESNPPKWRQTRP
jgi:hypothetical protein